MWKGRFKEATDKNVVDFTQSLDLDWRLAEADIRGSIAHVRMLAHTRLLPQNEAEIIEKNLREIATEIRNGDFIPSKELEDVHMNIESRLTKKCGATGARLHMGRSRNDQVATTMKLYLRKEMLSIAAQLDNLIEVLAKKADEHKNVIVPGYTHLQQAQPISMGHFWCAHINALLRDAKRLEFVLDALDECPLGSGALAGSTLPLDRKFSASDLGFAAPTENSMDSVASRDHFIDILYFASVFGGHVSRLCEDLIIYFTTEFGWVKLPDAFCTGSSIMPQKKNPDVLELLRGKSGQLTGALVDLLIMTKGIPMTYNRDLQDDKRSLFRTLDCLQGIFSVLPPLLSCVEVDEEKANKGFADGLILATDVAEYLVLQGVPFRNAHALVGGAVKWCVDNKRAMTSLSLAEWQALIPQVKEDLLPLLTPRVSAERRKTYGGTAPSEVTRQLKVINEKLAKFNEVCGEYAERLWQL